MALLDNLLVRVQPITGDTFIKNTVDGSNAAANDVGTISLVDDAGLKGWSITGLRTGTFTGGTDFMKTTPGKITMAVRMKVTTRTAEYYGFMKVKCSTGTSFGPSVSNPGVTSGALIVSMASTDGTSHPLGTPAYTNGQYITLVMRVGPTGFGDAIDAYWKNTVSRSGTTADGTAASYSSVATGPALQALIWGAASHEVTVTDLFVWNRGLTDAEAAAVADDIRGQLPLAAAATKITASGPASGTVGVPSAPFTFGADGTITGTAVVTPNAALGTWSPSTVSISNGTPTGTATLAASSTGALSVTTTNNGGLTNSDALSYTSNAAGDVTAPVMTGSVTASAITTTSYTISGWGATDAVGVTGYERSLDGGSTYTNIGLVTTSNVTGRTPGATDAVRIRAYDAAGNRATPLSASVPLTAPSSGTITTPVLKNNTGTILASQTGVVVNIYNATTGALVVRKTGQTSNGSGIVTVTDAAIVASTVYAYEVVLASAGRRLPVATAS